ncbi:hydrolase, TatD family [gut metagenome]|uniref:Hydrolase, TatD family n=1 Tax=gut metagenome TaxID=749906 RepID=J9GEZ9_9ZZZZ
MQYIDTHTHIYAEEFEADRDRVVESALAAGARYLLLPNIDGSSLPLLLQLCAHYPGCCLPMMGLHPTELPENPDGLLDEMEAQLNCPDHPFIAIGEVGIDLYWDDSRKAEQIAVFRRQIEWSIRYDLPLCIHTRSAHRELIDTLSPYADRIPGGVFHCFGGTAEEAEELLTRFPNFYLGIGGVVTFKKSKLPAVLKAKVPLSRILTETDAPYLTPTPYRGQRNEPAYIPFIVAKLAEIYEISVEEAGERTAQNARTLFRLD